jgi:hypothetical protein
METSTPAFLQQLRAEGFELMVEGDHLRIRPAERVTPELRDQLAHHKVALLEALRPSRAYVTLRDGPTLPVEAVELALDLERRGFRQSIDAAGCYQVEPPAGLNGDDRARLARWRNHVVAVLRYCEQERVQ